MVTHGVKSSFADKGFMLGLSTQQANLKKNRDSSDGNTFYYIYKLKSSMEFNMLLYVFIILKS